LIGRENRTRTRASQPGMWHFFAAGRSPNQPRCRLSIGCWRRNGNASLQAGQRSGTGAAVVLPD
jgi:hypothetical protein